MSSGLEKRRLINPETLDSDDYFQSLTEKAHALKLLTDEDLSRLQNDCLGLLQVKIQRYNGDFSSSIKVEKAQSLLASVCFTIDLGLKTYPHPDDGAAALKIDPLLMLYEKGRKRIDTMAATTRAAHARLCSELADVKNDFYRATIVDGINGFFKRYDPDFFAHEIHITADYPTFIPIPKLSGIAFISAYVNALYLENMLCRLFSPECVHHLLCGYAPDYHQLVMNIYEPVLLAALGCALVGTDESTLDISPAGAKYLGRLFAGMPKGAVIAVLQEAADTLGSKLQLKAELRRYIRASLPYLGAIIEAAAASNTLNRVFILPDYPETRPKIQLAKGEKMADSQYRALFEQIRKSPDAEKILLIQRHIHSLADMEDILIDADLTAEMIQGVLGGLSLPEIAALAEKYLPAFDTEEADLREQELLLKDCLKAFISGLHPDGQLAVNKIRAMLQS